MVGRGKEGREEKGREGGGVEGPPFMNPRYSPEHQSHDVCARVAAIWSTATCTMWNNNGCAFYLSQTSSSLRPR